MIDIKWLRSNKHKLEIEEYIKSRNIDDIKYKELMLHDENLRSLKFNLESLLSEKKKLSKQFYTLANQGSKEIKNLENIIKETDDKIYNLKQNLIDLESKINNIISFLPNILQAEVPIGKSEDENKIIKYWGEKPEFKFQPKSHEDISKDIDIPLGVSLSGAKFSVIKNKTAKLERALVNFMIDQHEKYFEEVSVPFIVSEETMFGSGQLPKFKDDLFKIEKKDEYLIPTGEVPLVNLFKNQIINDTKRYVTCTPCFRKEAGSSGKASKGLTRLHQFTKVEIVSATHESNSEQEHQFLLSCAEKILQLLNLHYRVSLLCSGDTGDTSSKTYDLEVWLPGENEYREISSCSNCLDFQSRRIRLKTKDKKFAHTLNSSGLAVGRTIIAILENYQSENGKVKIPEVLKSYMGNINYI